MHVNNSEKRKRANVQFNYCTQIKGKNTVENSLLDDPLNVVKTNKIPIENKLNPHRIV